MLFASCTTIPVEQIRPDETVAVESRPRFSAELANYPITDKFLRSAKRLIDEYELYQKYHLLHISANFTDTLEGDNKAEACRVINQHITDRLQSKGDARDTCTPTYSCDYDQARFPATLLKVTCPRKKCIDEKRYRGACLPTNSDLTFLRFKEESGSDQDTTTGAATESGSGEELYPELRRGKWYHHTVTLATDCYCSNAK